MILFIDTSSASVATIGTIDQGFSETFSRPGPVLLAEAVKGYVRSGRITKVAVASGPGSFTGLRVGVSVGLGIAMGLRVPIVPLPSLALQAARADDPVTAVGHAGRGRYYYLVPGGNPALGRPADIPTTYPLVGRVANHEAPLIAAGHRFKPANELRWLVAAAEILLRTAREVPYRNLEIRYMQTFTSKA